MAKAGDIIDNPVTGERIVVLQSAQETDGAPPSRGTAGRFIK